MQQKKVWVAIAAVLLAIAAVLGLARRAQTPTTDELKSTGQQSSLEDFYRTSQQMKPTTESPQIPLEQFDNIKVPGVESSL